MNLRKYKLIAAEKSPSIDAINKENIKRHEVVEKLQGTGNIGIELGVAKGIYSSRMVQSGRFKAFFGVDMYGDIHDNNEYLNTLKYVGFDNPTYRLIRTDFESALELFPDQYFDFIYVDGFAHTGEEGGKTLIDWWPKLKTGGILAGDDYHLEWPLVVWAVNDFVFNVDAQLNLATDVESEVHSRYPTWWIQKKTNAVPPINEVLYQISQREKQRIHWLRTSRIARFYARGRRFLTRVNKKGF